MLRWRAAGVLVGLALALPSQKSTAAVSWTFTGVITSETGDLAGLVDLPGSAIGAPITGSVSYDGSVFGVPNPISTSVMHTWDSTGGSLPNGTVTVTETINGVAFRFDGTYYNGVLLASGNPGGGDWPYSSWNQAYEVLSEVNSPWGTDTAEINLGRTDGAATLVDPSLNPVLTPDLQAIQMQVAATDWFTPSGLVSWSFVIAEAEQVPEPGALGLLGLGMVGLGAARHLSREGGRAWAFLPADPSRMQRSRSV